MSSNVIGKAVPAGVLSDSDVESVVEKGLAGTSPKGQRFVVLVPDATRTFPAPLFFRLLTKHLLPQARAVDFLVALGTHVAMSNDALCKMMGITREDKATTYKSVRLLNHAWDDPAALTQMGMIPAEEIEQLSGGLMKMEVPVRLNRMVLDYDQIIICGPVFPHEVAGFSGGNKYFFPGIAGPDIINFTHWLGALITSYDIIGTKDTPVRRTIDRAAAFIPRPKHALSCVVTHEGIAGVFFGPPEASQAAAADISAQRHIVWKEKPYNQVLAAMPAMYDEIWVGAKGMYKAEPATADGAEVIIYAPHIREISQVHGRIIRQIGYHVRDYFVAQWDKFKHIPWGVLAHSTHVKGNGSYANGVEKPRVTVTLATGISEEDTRAVNLNYRNPKSIDPGTFAGREADGVLYIPKAGEYLFKVRKA